VSAAVNITHLSEVPILLDQLRREKFYGRLSFDLRDGEVTLIRTERTQLVSPKPHQGENRDVRCTQSDRH
jgi:hypothetical protein